MSGFINITQNNDAYITTIEFIDSSEEVQDRLGEIKGYGLMPMGTIAISNGHGVATFLITVKGEKETVKMYSMLEKEPYSEGQIIQIDYVE